jgi:outer membrane protein TolC
VAHLRWMRRAAIAGGPVVVALAAALATTGPASAAPLTLPGAIQKALSFAPSVAMASATSDFSRARVGEMRAPLLPSVSAGTEYYQAPGYAQVVTNRGLSSAMLSLDWTAFDFGRRRSRLSSARYASQAARFGVTAAQAQIAFDTKGAYFDLIRAQTAAHELESSLKRLSRYVTTVETLHRSGQATMNDVLRVRSARDSTELALSEARSRKRRAATALGALMGEFDRSDFELSYPGGIPPMPAGDLAQSPTLKAADRAVEAAKMLVKAAQAERYPTFQLALTSGFLGVDPPSTVDHHLGASYDGVFSMPIYQGGLIASHIDQAKAKQAEAVAQAREAKYILRRRLDDAALAYRQARDALGLLARAEPTADDAFALDWARFLGGGRVTLLEVLSAYEESEQLRLARFDQEFAARQAAAEGALLLGRTE